MAGRSHDREEPVKQIAAVVHADAVQLVLFPPRQHLWARARTQEAAMPALSALQPEKRHAEALSRLARLPLGFLVGPRSRHVIEHLTVCGCE